MIVFQSLANAFSFLSNETCDWKFAESRLQKKKKKKITLRLVCAGRAVPAEKGSILREVGPQENAPSSA